MVDKSGDVVAEYEYVVDMSGDVVAEYGYE